MDFDAYLQGKKIDAAGFKSYDNSLYIKLKTLFDQVHPNSFTQQKLFLINKIRRKFHLEEDVKEKPKAAASKVKPRILPGKPKI